MNSQHFDAIKTSGVLVNPNGHLPLPGEVHHNSLPGSGIHLNICNE
jgi:hypothetical protein